MKDVGQRKVFSSGIDGAFNVNIMYGNLKERYAAATMGLRRTSYGRQGVIKVVTSGDFVKFELSATREIFDTIEEATNAANRINISEVVQFGRRTAATGAQRRAQRAASLTNKYGAFAGIFDNIHQKLSSLDPATLAVLRDAGIDVGNLGTLEMDIVTLGQSADGIKGTALNIQRLRENKELFGISMLDDEGGRILTMRTRSGMLDEYQMNLIFSAVGHDIYDRHTMNEFFDMVSDPAKFGKASNTLAKMFEKSAKRQAAYLSSRDISLSENELASIIRRFAANSKKKGVSQLDDVALITDPQYELLMKYAHGNNFSLGDNIDLLYRNFDAEKYFNEMFDTFGTSQNLQLIDEFKNAIRTFVSDPNLKTWKSDQLLTHLENAFSGNVDGQELVARVFKSIEHAYDGSDLLNMDFINAYVAELKGKLTGLNKDINNPSISPEVKRASKRAKNEIIDQIAAIERGDFSQVTGRANLFIAQLGREMNLKNAFSGVIDLGSGFSLGGNNNLQDVAMVLNKFSFKGDTDIAGGVKSFLLSGIGEPRDMVYVDPVSAAFHPEAFADEKTIAAAEIRSRNILEEYDSIVKSGIVPEDIKKMLKHQASQNVESLSPELRSSARRNREFAQTILDMIRAGLKPNDTPALANMLQAMYATRAFREKKGLVQLGLEGTFRFAIDVDKPGYEFSSGTKVQGAFKDIGGINIGGASFANNAKAMNFRIEGHRMLINAHAAGIYHHSLGGFDLDDKSMPKLMTYTDNQMRKRLGFYVFRQPSGPEEVIFAKAQLDQSTIKALFNNTLFSETLDEMMNGNLPQGQSQAFSLIRQALLSGDVPNRNDIVEYQVYRDLDSRLLNNEAEVEQAIVSILERQESRGQLGLVRITEEGAKKLSDPRSMFGSTLATTDLVERVPDGNGGFKLVNVDPKFTRPGIYKALLDDGAFDMSEDILGILDQFNINSNLKHQLKSTSSLPVDERFQKIMEILGGASEVERSAIISTARGRMGLKGAEQAEGILGVYINRSMVVGSTLNQYEDFLTELSRTNKNLADYMKQNFRIGLLSQEKAIDLSVTFSRAKILSEETARIIEAQAMGLMNEEKAASAIARLANISGTKVTIDDIGEATVANLGKVIGFGRTVAQASGTGFSKDLLLGVDEFLLFNKYSEGDRFTLLQEISRGMEVAQSQLGPGISPSQQSASLLEEMKKALAIKDQEKIDEILRANFSLKGSHKYASLAKLQAAGQKVKSYFEAVNRANLNRMGMNPSLVSAKITDEEASVAQSLLKRYRPQLESIFNIAYSDLKEFTDLQLYDLEQFSMKTGTEFLDAMLAASKMKGVTIRGLATGLERELRMDRSRVDIKSLKFMYEGILDDLPSAHADMLESLINASRLNQLEYMLNFDQTTARNIISNLAQHGTVTSDSLASLAKKELDNIAQGVVINQDEQNILLSLLDRDSEILDDLSRSSSQLEASIVRSILDHDEMVASGMVDQLNESGTIDNLADAAASVAATGRQVDDDTLKAIVDSVTGASNQQINVKRAKYSRIMDKIRSTDPGDINQLKELIDNKFIKKGLVGLGALVVGSFAYKSFKTRSQDDISGPPLLPGGSAYESDYPNRIPHISEYSSDGYSPGVRYKVSAQGNPDDVRRFNQLAAGLANGNINTTMYNRIPELGRDPYSSIGSSY